MASPVTRTIESLHISVLWRPQERTFGGVVTHFQYGSSFTDKTRRLDPSGDPSVIYEELTEEVGMWLTNLLERMREAATLF